GGGNTTLRGYLLEGLPKAGFDARDPGQHGELDRSAKCNIGNPTLLGMGTQPELSTPQRDAIFTKHSRPRPKHTTTQVSSPFPAVCRDALERLEAEQTVARTALRCLESCT